MKKIISFLLVLAALVSLSACKVNQTSGETEPFSPDEFQSQLDAQQALRQSQIEASIQAQNEIEQEIDEYIAKVGKTVKGKELVLELNWSLGRKYQKYVFDKKENTDYRIDYFFYDSEENYEASIEVEKEKDNVKIIEKDAKMKMLVVKRTSVVESTFDKLYEAYSTQELIDLGYSIVE